VSGNILAGTNGYGKEVLVEGVFRMSGEARPERIFLLDNNHSITINGPLGGGPTPIDLGVTPFLTGWVNKAILQKDSSYNSGDLASLKAHFTLGNVTLTISPYTETAITGYGISDEGLFVSN
jgi:hypothetical protein